jgi:hypothetical protein
MPLRDKGKAGFALGQVVILLMRIATCPSAGTGPLHQKYFQKYRYLSER